MGFKNYGDVNFWDQGIILEPDSNDENCFRIITCSPDADMENHYLVQEAFIDITDSWIDKHDVCSYAGLRDVSIDYTEEEEIWFAIAILNYYGGHTGCSQQWCTKNEAIEFVNQRADIDDYEFWKNNFDDDCRNVIVSIYSDYGIKDRRVYDSLEDALEDFKDDCEKGWSFEIEDM